MLTDNPWGLSLFVTHRVHICSSLSECRFGGFSESLPVPGLATLPSLPDRGVAFWPYCRRPSCIYLGKAAAHLRHVHDLDGSELSGLHVSPLRKQHPASMVHPPQHRRGRNTLQTHIHAQTQHRSQCTQSDMIQTWHSHTLFFVTE